MEAANYFLYQLFSAVNLALLGYALVLIYRSPRRHGGIPRKEFIRFNVLLVCLFCFTLSQFNSFAMGNMGIVWPAKLGVTALAVYAILKARSDRRKTINNS